MEVDKFVYLESVDYADLNEILISWRRDNPQMGVLALACEAEKDAVPGLQKIFSDLGIPLAGAVFPELVVDGAFKKRGILISLLKRMPAHIVLKGLSKHGNALDSSIEELAGFVTASGQKGRKDTLFLIIDAMIPTIATILDSLYFKLADMVSYMGVNAGSETFQPMPCVFTEKEFTGDALLALILPDHEGASLEHGYIMPEEMITATSTSGNRIINIDWKPAFEVYARMAQSRYGVEVTKENFYQMGVHFPFGIIRADDEVLVRIPVALEEDGSLFCVGEIPENAILTLLAAPESGSTATVDALTDRLKNKYRNFVLTFYCAGRRLHLGAAAENELGALSERLSPARIAGALSLGEIGSSIQGGYPLFHNGTIVCASWDNL
ncbi:MAG: FIST C-terminal domain-containing protein [Nitrospinae bacterium]|nr:FIST C-terminal domain-containing protein [Nitrospinota bacterium]